MPKQSFRVGVLAVSRQPVSRWAERGFQPCAVLPAEPATLPFTRVSPEGPLETWYLGGAHLTLHSGDTGHHRDNLSAARPSLWVALRGGRWPDRAPEIACVTADPYEGEALAGDPALVVEAVALPEALAAEVAAFFAAHHVEQAFHKRKRKRADPEALGRRGLVGEPRR